MKRTDQGTHALFVLLVAALAVTAAASWMTGRGEAAPSFPLLATHWGQTGVYARFTPGNERAGCWSTALAQILYYHRLQPSGSVSYRCSDGTVVSENVGAQAFNWNLFVNDINATTSEPAADEVARYIYYVSVVIEKDFGTGDYVLAHSDRARALSRYFDCRAKLYTNESSSMGQIVNVIKAELDAGRPVMMHLRDRARSNFHAVAVDGYRSTGGNLEVHVNMGHEGEGDGWYLFGGTIGGYDDNSYRRVMTVARGGG
ncbi:MAG: C10 family peptidase [Thermotogota bacterium]